MCGFVANGRFRIVQDPARQYQQPGTDSQLRRIRGGEIYLKLQSSILEYETQHSSCAQKIIRLPNGQNAQPLCDS